MAQQIAGAGTTDWREDFEARAGHHATVTVDVPTAIDHERLEALGPSLATFQLGESGDGHHLISVSVAANSDLSYIHALRAFVVEEQEHARLLALVLSAMGQPLRTSHWSDHAFMVLRRLRSLRTEVLTLLVAELIALRYYSALRDGFADCPFSEVFERIHRDEVRHIEFHLDTLRPRLADWRASTRGAARLAWTTLVTVTSVLVALDHQKALRAAGLNPFRFVADIWTIRADVDQRLFQEASGPGAQRPVVDQCQGSLGRFLRP